MATLDITFRDDIAEALAPPEPRSLCIPFPPEPAQIRVPGGFRITGVSNVTEKIPDDCALTFSLFAQLGPFVGNFKCIFDILSLLAPLIEIMGGLVKGELPPLDTVNKFLKASEEVLKCVAQFTTTAGLAQFIIDVLDLILKILACVIDALKTALSLVDGIEIDLASARAAENTVLIAALECAHENAMNSAKATLTAVEPIPALLDILSAAMAIAQADPIEFPTLEQPESAEALRSVIEVLDDTVAVITTVRNSIPV